MRPHTTRIAPLALLSGTPLLAWAHPGHDSAPAMGWFEGLGHLLSQPDHLGMLGAALLLALALLLRRQRSRGRIRP
jgi:hypothetical protein